VHEPHAAGSLDVSVHAVPQTPDPDGHEQVDPAHEPNVGQGVVQSPQCLGSVLRSTHWLPQVVPPQLQLDAAQVPPVPHDFPHTPQFIGSLVRSTHFAAAPVPHTTVVPGQVHTLATHVAPVAHSLPHAPQFFASVVRSTHPLVHEVLPVPHSQTPPLHNAPLHDFPHAPQFLLSLAKLVHAVGHALGKVDGQTHEPSMQKASKGHFVVHVPHALVSLVRSLHVAPQFTFGSGQPHFPATQALPAGHALAHEPQFLPSVLVSTQSEPHRVCSATGHGPKSVGASPSGSVESPIDPSTTTYPSSLEDKVQPPATSAHPTTTPESQDLVTPPSYGAERPTSNERPIDSTEFNSLTSSAPSPAARGPCPWRAR